MKNTFLGGALVAVLCFGLAWTGYSAAAHKGPELESLPQAAQKAIKEQLHDAKILCIDESLDNGALSYTVETKKEGTDRSFVIAEDGSLLRQQVRLEELPSEVQKGLRKELGGGTLDQIDKLIGEDGTTYDVEMTKNGKDRSFSLSEEGTLVSAEVFLDETPARVRKAILTRVGSGRLGEIFKNIEDGEATYDISMTQHRRPFPFSLDSDGGLVSATVLMRDLPAAVQKAIRAKVDDGYIDKVEMLIDAGKITYEVSFTKSDSAHTIDVSADGKIIDTDEPDDAPARLRA